MREKAGLHGSFPNCTTCGFPIDSGGFCSLSCKGGDAEMVSCTCTACRLTAADAALLVCQQERDKGKLALEKINAIRNDIIGRQTIGWSSHIYPLVAALNEAGYIGTHYDVARSEALTLIQELEQAEAALALCQQERDDAQRKLATIIEALSESGFDDIARRCGVLR